MEGFDYFWTVEHHFLNEFSHCSAPEVLYGALSQRTRRIRIGHAVALLPGQYNHPVRVAERAAVLDIVSDGRVDLGTGRSTTLIEMDGFEVNPADTKAQWEEAISMIPRMWTEDTFSHEGRFYSIPPRKVIPSRSKPLIRRFGWPAASPTASAPPARWDWECSVSTWRVMTRWPSGCRHIGKPSSTPSRWASS